MADNDNIAVLANPELDSMSIDELKAKIAAMEAANKKPRLFSDDLYQLIVEEAKAQVASLEFKDTSKGNRKMFTSHNQVAVLTVDFPWPGGTKPTQLNVTICVNGFDTAKPTAITPEEREMRKAEESFAKQAELLESTSKRTGVPLSPAVQERINSFRANHPDGK